MHSIEMLQKFFWVAILINRISFTQIFYDIVDIFIRVTLIELRFMWKEQKSYGKVMVILC